LYAFIKDQDAQKKQQAKQIIATTAAILVSVQLISEVWANIKKHQLLDEPGIRALIDSFYARYTVVDVTYRTLQEASTLREQYTLSYWDSTIIAAALESGITRLLSEDMQDGLLVRGTLIIVNPFV